MACETDHTIITDTLPVQVSPGGVLTWTPTIFVDDFWIQQVVVSVTEGYSGTLANLVEAVSAEGAWGNASVTSHARLSDKWRRYLPLILRNTP